MKATFPNGTAAEGSPDELAAFARLLQAGALPSSSRETPAPVPALPPVRGKVPCPKCGKQMKPKGLSIHLARAHGGAAEATPGSVSPPQLTVSETNDSLDRLTHAATKEYPAGFVFRCRVGPTELTHRIHASNAKAAIELHDKENPKHRFVNAWPVASGRDL